MSDTMALNTLAKLLANENINVVREAVDTASFHIVSRTLTLPMWKELTPEIEEMLALHEIGHALWTTSDYLEKAEALNFRGAHSFLNILEDVRSEKLTKRKYPGSRKTFHVGYRALNDLDFFGVKERNLNDLGLLDRINLYYKVGYNCGVKFNAKEKEFVIRTEQTESVDDVVALAKDIFDYLQLERESKRDETDDMEDNTMSMSGQSDSAEDDGDEDPSSDWDSDDEFEDQDGSSDENGEGEDDGEEIDDLERGDGEDSMEDQEHSFRDFQRVEQNDTDESEIPQTDRAFADRLAVHADQSTQYEYKTVGRTYYDPIIPFKTISQTVQGRLSNLNIDTITSNSGRISTQMFMSDTKNNVDYLVKEFEMKKAATSYKRSSISKTGALDMRRVWSYKLNNDLFKRVTTVKEGKNHGMVFLLDWSSSMHPYIQKTIDQLINLVSFCRRAQIPHEVFAFSDRFPSNEAFKKYAEETPANNGLMSSHGSFCLLEIFSHEMTNSQFLDMVTSLRLKRVQGAYPLGSTPLNEALIHMYNYIGEFQRKHNVEKTTFITLTDGEGSTLPNLQPSKYVRKENGEYVRINIRHVVADEKTKKSYTFTDDNNDQTTQLLRMIKDRHGCTVVGFMLVNNTQRSVARALYHNLGNVPYNMINRVRDELRGNGYCSIGGTGRDDLFLVPCDTKIHTDELKVTGDQTAKAIATKLTKHLTKKKTSRILLNKFIGYVA